MDDASRRKSPDDGDAALPDADEPPPTADQRLQHQQQHQQQHQLATPAATVSSSNPPPPQPHPRARRLPPPSQLRGVSIRSIGDRQQAAIRLRRLRRAAPNIAEDGQARRNSQLPRTPEAAAGVGGGEGFPWAQPPVSSNGESSTLLEGRLAPQLPPLPEGSPLNVPVGSEAGDGVSDGTGEAVPRPAATAAASRLRRGSIAGSIRNGLSFRRRAEDRNSVPSMASSGVAEEYDSRVVDFLDVIDPEVATLSSITNVQNSLFVPSLGRFVNRRPTYEVTPLARIPGSYPESVSSDDLSSPDVEFPTERQIQDPVLGEVLGEDGRPLRKTGSRAYSIDSQITDRYYAVLPHGISLEGWSNEEILELNDHVRHMLHSRRSKLKRSLKAFGKYVRKPLGFLVTLYAVLITLFGLAWVLFLIGWIYVGDRQSYLINVIDNVLVALFAVVGDGMIPFRLVDTYHMAFIAHYYRLTRQKRKKLALPKLKDKNDLPTEPVVREDDPRSPADIEAARPIHEMEEHSVLSPAQQATLAKHQAAFAKSHTFYKPHETETHFAFPMRLLIAIVILLDLHSCFQVALGVCTWSIDYHVRPQALTATILSCSITVNITAGILISIGDRRTRKKDVIERMARQELTEMAMRRVRKRQRKREDQERERLKEQEREKQRQLEREAAGEEGSEKVREGGWRKSLDVFRPGLDAFRPGRSSTS